MAFLNEANCYISNKMHLDQGYVGGQKDAPTRKSTEVYEMMAFALIYIEVELVLKGTKM